MLTATAVHCAPEAASASCRNDAECRALNDDLRYCVQRHCVQCVTSAACGSGSHCVRGQCAEE